MIIMFIFGYPFLDQSSFYSALIKDKFKKVQKIITQIRMKIEQPKRFNCVLIG